MSILSVVDDDNDHDLFKKQERNRKINVCTDIKTDKVTKQIIEFFNNNPYDYYTREEIQTHCKTTFYVISLSLKYLLNSGEIEIVRKISRNNVYQLKGFKERRKKLIDIYNEQQNDTDSK